MTEHDERVQALADGLRNAASTDDDPQATPAENWQQITRYALAHAGITLTYEEFDRAWRAAWKRAFMGGSYTLDARAILAAAEYRKGASE